VVERESLLSHTHFRWELKQEISHESQFESLLRLIYKDYKWENMALESLSR